MIEFKQLEIHNFMSFKDATLELNNRGLTLIEGINNSSNTYVSNGSGKSSLMAGLTYALFGKTVEGISSDEVINREVGTDCHVFLTFDLNGVSYRIERYRKGKNNNRNKVKLFANDKEVTQAVTSKTNAQILELLGISFDTYVNTIVYGQGDIPIFSKATDKGKKEILENLANTAIYEKARAVASSNKTLNSNKLSEQKATLTNLESQLEQTKLYQERSNKDYQEALAKVESQKKFLDQQKRKLASMSSKVEQAEKDYNEVKKVVANKQYPTFDNSLITKANQDKDELSKLEAAIMYSKNQTNDLMVQYKALDTQETCPTCGQPINESHKKLERARIKTKVLSLATTFTKDKNKYDSLNIVYKQEADLANNMATEMSKVYEEKAQDNKRVSDAALNLKGLKSQQDQLEYFVNSASTQSEVSKPQDFTEDIKALEEKISSLKTEITELASTVDEYNTLATQVFSRTGIQSMAMDLIIPFLNEHTNHYLSKLSGSLLTVNMDTQTMNADKTLADKFNLQVFNGAGADNYLNCSAGEKKRIDIAISFAIQDLQNSKSNMATNLAVYDECFDGLDSVGAENVVEVLKEKQKEIGTIFVITHNETLKPLFDNVLTVEKGKDGISHILEGVTEQAYEN